MFSFDLQTLTHSDTQTYIQMLFEGASLLEITMQNRVGVIYQYLSLDIVQYYVLYNITFV